MGIVSSSVGYVTVQGIALMTVTEKHEGGNGIADADRNLMERMENFTATNPPVQML
jgi:hypothetical protein